MCFSNVASDIFMVLSFLFLVSSTGKGMMQLEGLLLRHMHHLVLGSERVIWMDRLPPRHAAEPKHVYKRPISCVKRRKRYLFSQLTEYCICRCAGGQSTSRYLSLGSLICSKRMQAQYTHPAAHSHVALPHWLNLFLCAGGYTPGMTLASWTVSWCISHGRTWGYVG